MTNEELTEEVLRLKLEVEQLKQIKGTLYTSPQRCNQLMNESHHHHNGSCCYNNPCVWC